MTPLPALAEGSSSSSGSSTATSQPTGEPPSGGGSAPGDAGGSMPVGGAGGAGGANTMTYDYTGTLSGTLTADGDSQEASDQTITATDVDVNAA